MYLNFYQLREEPFRLTPDPKFLQLAEPHRNALSVLAQGVVARKGLMLFSGPIGTGKTTILNGLLSILARSFPKETLPTAFIVNPRLSPEELLETLLFEFEVPRTFNSKPCRIAALQGLMFAASKERGTCLLLVDEAHLLTVDVLEEIRLLMNAESYHEKLLQVILCGQPELTDLLRTPALRAVQQRVAARASLRELSPGEARMYITERLRIAGLEKGNSVHRICLRQDLRIYRRPAKAHQHCFGRLSCHRMRDRTDENWRGHRGRSCRAPRARIHCGGRKKDNLAAFPAYSTPSQAAKAPSRSEL